jgi:hypothetical protein
MVKTATVSLAGAAWPAAILTSDPPDDVLPATAELIGVRTALKVAASKPAAAGGGGEGVEVAINWEIVVWVGAGSRVELPVEADPDACAALEASGLEVGWVGTRAGGL